MTTRRRLVLLAGLALTISAAADERPALPRASAPRLDARAPVPLTPMMAEHQKSNMRDHLAVVQEIIAGLATDDLHAVAEAARRIGYSDAMAAMCHHMGAGAPGFTELALGFHRTADTIGDAARRGDAKGAIRALGETLRTCVGCHAAYRQEVVDDDAWSRITGGPAPQK
jgi:hypothetical protein